MADVITLTGNQRQVIGSDMDALFAEFRKPLTSAEIEWKIATNKTGQNATLVPYIDNRAVLNRLDKAFGPGGWQSTFVACDGGFLCGISILIEGQWVWKWDGAGKSEIEPFKGGVSDAQKRAAHQWGLGRELYSYPMIQLKWEGENKKFIPYHVLPRLQQMVEMITAGKFTRDYVLLNESEGKK